jgi:hypothetical protein
MFSGDRLIPDEDVARWASDATNVVGSHQSWPMGSAWLPSACPP